jgi:hypothetical protein
MRKLLRKLLILLDLLQSQENMESCKTIFGTPSLPPPFPPNPVDIKGTHVEIDGTNVEMYGRDACREMYGRDVCRDVWKGGIRDVWILLKIQHQVLICTYQFLTAHEGYIKLPQAHKTIHKSPANQIQI